MLICKVVQVWQDFLSEYVDKKFTYICYRRLIRHEYIYYGSKNCVIKLCNLQQLNIAVFTYRSPHFCFPWGRPWGNHAKCCMDGKRIWCLQVVLQHVLIYLQQFPSYSNRKCKKLPFHVPPPTFLFPLETPLWLSRNMLHGCKDNSMLAKPLAACTYLSSIVSKLYDA